MFTSSCLKLPSYHQLSILLLVAVSYPPWLLNPPRLYQFLFYEESPSTFEHQHLQPTHMSRSGCNSPLTISATFFWPSFWCQSCRRPWENAVMTWEVNAYKTIPMEQCPTIAAWNTFLYHVSWWCLSTGLPRFSSQLVAFLFLFLSCDETVDWPWTTRFCLSTFAISYCGFDTLLIAN